MKKFSIDGRAIIAVGMVFIIIALFDTLGNDANSYSEMTWWGKSSIIGFMSVLGIAFIKFMLIPICYALYKGAKKLVGK